MRHVPTQRWTHPAFTLPEILIVLAVFVLVGGLVYPVLMESRRRANLATCISNIRQIYAAVKMYEGDYGAVPVQMGSEPGEHWIDRLDPYFKDSRIFLCSADKSGGREVAWSQHRRSSYIYFYTRVHLNASQQYRKPALTSPLIGCNYHKDYQIVLGRYDGSVELAPLRRYPMLKIQFQQEP